MTRSRSRILVLGGTLWIALAAAMPAGSPPADALAKASTNSPTNASTPLAGLVLVDAAGAPYHSASGGAGTLVGIWASWCPSCREDLPALIRLGHELRDRDVRLLLVSVDRVPERGARHLASLGYRGEAAYDPAASSVRRLGIQGIPTVLLLDGAGRERERITGSGAEIMTRLKTKAIELAAGPRRGKSDGGRDGDSHGD
jgi:thiol-disulfide isomerase/thioredoxin